MTAPDLSIVIVTWNSRDDVLRCLDAVESGKPALDVEVVLVDNASSDDTVSAVRSRYPHVRIVENSTNRGFPRANNQGLEIARGRHILLLNPDTQVGSDTVGTCVETLDVEAEVGAVGCRLLYPDGSVQYECARRAYRLAHLVWEAFYLHVIFPRNRVFAHQLMGDWDHTGVRDVEAISGAFFMARREVFDAVARVPDAVFMYHEDLSLCLKIRERGWRIRFRGDVSTVHHHGRSAGQSSLALHLLEGPVRVLLIQARAGRFAGAAARVLFAFRGGVRLVLSVLGWLIPGTARLRRERPRAFDPRVHLDQILWALLPWAVRDRMPRATRS
ncbi:MAG: glycosyltransferase family 2 protein [Longimicrobiales bacterium]